MCVHVKQQQRKIDHDLGTWQGLEEKKGKEEMMQLYFN